MGGGSGHSRTGPARRERLGVLGGTFDPPHRGHLALAEAARDQLGLDRVLLVVAGDPWQKRGEVEASAADRLAMVEALVDGLDRVEASSLEIDRGGPSYTVDTLEALAAPGRELFLVVGADAAGGLRAWKRWERIRELASLGFAARVPDGEGDRRQELEAMTDRLRADGWRCRALELSALPVSSTALRELLAGGEAGEPDVPAPVMRVIRERGLYTRRR